MDSSIRLNMGLLKCGTWSLEHVKDQRPWFLESCKHCSVPFALRQQDWHMQGFVPIDASADQMSWAAMHAVLSQGMWDPPHQHSRTDRQHDSLDRHMQPGPPYL